MAKNPAIQLIVLAGLVACSGCWRADTRTVELEIPKLSSTECSQHVLNALARIEGIKEAQPILETQKLIVTYNARKTAFKNIEYAIAHAGFDVNDSAGKADAKAKLPEECR